MASFEHTSSPAAAHTVNASVHVMPRESIASDVPEMAPALRETIANLTACLPQLHEDKRKLEDAVRTLQSDVARLNRVTSSPHEPITSHNDGEESQQLLAHKVM